MLHRTAFYLNYAWRNLRRSARWTTFAVFCIAAGVATVVALRSLGLAIGDSLIDSTRASNHGDIRIDKDRPNPFSGFTDIDQDVFTPGEISAVRAWAEDNNAVVDFYKRLSNFQITRVDVTTAGRPQFVSAFLIDPATFPTDSALGTGTIYAVDPEGVPLSALFQGDRDIVISRNLADQQGIAVGDTVRVSGTEEPFTVRGIVPTETEANFEDLFAAFFGFAYFNVAQADLLGIDPTPNSVGISFRDPTDEVRRNNAENELRQVGVRGFVNTVDEVLERNAFIADVIGRFIVIMGLGALLIGGVGIINTMLVLVGRRTTEIAALKTFGLKGGQVAAMFLAEAFLLGLIGSAVGCLLGIGLSGLVNQYGEAFLQQRLVWRLYPEAIAYGMGLGLIVTLVFGVLPILTANRVRPATILRPNETVIPAAGCLQSLIALLLVILVIGGVAGSILGNVVVGIIAVAVTLIILGVLVGVLWVLVWFVSKLPAFGLVDVRLALRNLTARRVRTATTLLALSAGMFALSSISFVGAGTRELLQFQLTQNLGGNVLVFPVLNLISQGVGQGLLNLQLQGIEGIEATTTITTVSSQLEALDGRPISINLPFEPPNARGARAIRSIQLQVRETEGQTTALNIVSGRDLLPEDRGQRLLVVSEDFADPYVVTNTDGTVSPAAVRVGSEITLRGRDGRPEVFTVIGIARTSGGFNFGGGGFIPPDALTTSTSFAFTVLQVRPENLNNVLLALSANPLVFALDLQFIDGLLGRLINQFAALPTLVGLLSLLAAAVTMANTVSLATLERRRQIGILKAVGLKSRRVLGVMLIENTLIGLLGGILGIGLSALGVAIMTAVGQGDAIPIPRDSAPVAIALVIASVVIAWVATFLSARPVTQESVINVLRYE